jgi:hypothetical protein
VGETTAVVPTGEEKREAGESCRGIAAKRGTSMSPVDAARWWEREPRLLPPGRLRLLWYDSGETSISEEAAVPRAASASVATAEKEEGEEAELLSAEGETKLSTERVTAMRDSMRAKTCCVF